MATIPRKCPHCGSLVHHYGACSCPDATLDWIDAERKTIQARLVRLKEIEKEALTDKLKQLGVIGG